MPTIPVTGATSATTPTSLTIADVFTNKGLWLWWTQNNGEGTNPFDGIKEKGIDYSTAFGTPVGVPVGGQIVRLVHNNNAINDVVELQASDGSVWLYQHITARVSVGETLLCGDVIGTENGLPITPGISTGPHIEVRYCKPGTWSANTDSWYEPWVNPYGVFSSLSYQIAGNYNAGAASSFSVPGIVQKAQITLSPSADVATVFVTMDTLLQLTNPFDTSCENVDQLSIFGASFDNPFSWVATIAGNVIADWVALVLRAFLFFIGAFILLKVVSNFIDYGAVAQTAGNVGKLAAFL